LELKHNNDRLFRKSKDIGTNSNAGIKLVESEAYFTMTFESYSLLTEIEHLSPLEVDKKDVGGNNDTSTKLREARFEND